MLHNTFALKVACTALLLALLGGGVASAGDRAEEESFRRVAAAREQARRSPEPEAVRLFERRAREYLERFPDGASVGTVRIWLGDLLRDRDPRAAMEVYRASTDVTAIERREALAFRFEAPPELQVDRWVGERPDLSDRVALIVFFSVTHPQTTKAIERLVALHRAYAERGLSVIGIAAVVDDREQQRPEHLETRLKERGLPFPSAVDRQGGGDRSRSFALYRGKVLPWMALLDRYGRVDLVDALGLEGNPAAQVEARIRALLEDPGYAELCRLVRSGDGAALDRLRAIRTPAAADTLFECAQSPEKGRVAEALRALLPDGYVGDDLPAAAERWRRERARFRYSFEKDRLVAE